MLPTRRQRNTIAEQLCPELQIGFDLGIGQDAALRGECGGRSPITTRASVGDGQGGGEHPVDSEPIEGLMEKLAELARCQQRSVAGRKGPRTHEHETTISKRLAADGTEAHPVFVCDRGDTISNLDGTGAGGGSGAGEFHYSPLVQFVSDWQRRVVAGHLNP
jgi:hypothetical protein